MRTLRQIIYVALLALVIVGCQSQTEFGDSDFGEVVSLKGEVRNVDTTLSINDIWAVKDSIIVAHTSGQRDSMFLVLDARDWAVKSNIKGARGDAELIKSRESIMIFDPLPGRVTVADSWGEMQGKIWNLPVDANVQNVYHDGSSYLYESYDESLRKNLVYLNRESQTVLTDFASVLKISPDASIYRGFAGISRNAQKVVFAYRYLRRVEIYSNSGEVVSVSVDKSAAKPRVNSDGAIDVSGSVAHYNGLFATPERIYIHYVGATIDQAPAVTYVEEWDWDGNPVKRYELDGDFNSFVYVNGYFVGVPKGAASALVTYKMEQ